MPKQYIKIVKELKALLFRRFGEEIKQVVLFGSRSQGTARRDSDYDILIVLNNDYTWQQEHHILKTCYEIDLKYDIVTDVKVISVHELQSIKGQQPYILHAIREGVAA